MPDLEHAPATEELAVKRLLPSRVGQHVAIGIATEAVCPPGSRTRLVRQVVGEPAERNRRDDVLVDQIGWIIYFVPHDEDHHNDVISEIAPPHPPRAIKEMASR